MYVIFIVKQVYWYISGISGERIQDHWSSGYIYDSLTVFGCCEMRHTFSTFKMQLFTLKSTMHIYMGHQAGYRYKITYSHFLIFAVSRSHFDF